MSGHLVYADPHARCAHRRYKLTCEEYDALVSATDGCCAVCGTYVPRLLVDHDHRLGRSAVRGLVCRSCNALLRDVDSGRRTPTVEVTAYLANAWHVGREHSAAPQARRTRSRSAATMAAAEAFASS